MVDAGFAKCKNFCCKIWFRKNFNYKKCKTKQVTILNKIRHISTQIEKFDFKCCTKNCDQINQVYGFQFGVKYLFFKLTCLNSIFFGRKGLFDSLLVITVSIFSVFVHFAFLRKKLPNSMDQLNLTAKLFSLEIFFFVFFKNALCFFPSY